MNAQKGFSLIELMIVIAIIGILASVAVPQYQDYVLRTDATNTLSVARPLQLAVGEYAARYSAIPADWTELNDYTGISVTATDHAAGKIASIDLINSSRSGEPGTLLVTFADTTDGVPAKLANKTYELIPDINSNGVVTWESYTSNASNDPSVTELSAKFLPKTK